MNNNTVVYTLQDLNADHIRELIVPIVYFVILFIIGVPGNLTVLIIYGKKYASCVYRSIIWNLAVADLTFCTLGIPFNIARVVHYYTFTELWVCKISITLLIFGIMYSTHLLMLLSLHRFRQICMPLRAQITVTNVRYCILACVVIAALLSLPQVVLQPLEQHNLTGSQLEYNLTGSVCPVTASNPTKYWLANNYFLTSLFTLYTLVLFAIYLMIGRQVYLQKKRAKELKDTSTHHNFSNKMTKIAFTISVVFALSYIPLFVLKVTKEIMKEDDLNPVQFTVLRTVERSYLVNHVANPFIYAIFDKRFRQHFKSIVTFGWFRVESHTESSSRST